MDILDKPNHSQRKALGHEPTSEKIEQVAPLKGTPIFETGASVRVAQVVALDPACKVSDYIGARGIVRYMIATERGQPCEWCAVYWPHRGATSIWHADTLEEIAPH